MTVDYFKKLVIDETAKLNLLCDKWESLANENENIPETSKFKFNFFSNDIIYTMYSIRCIL